MEEKKKSSAKLWLGLGMVFVGYLAELFALASISSRARMVLPDWLEWLLRLWMYGCLPMILFGGYLLARYKRRSPLWALAALFWFPGFVILAMLLVLPLPEDYQSRS